MPLCVRCGLRFLYLHPFSVTAPLIVPVVRLLPQQSPTQPPLVPITGCNNNRNNGNNRIPELSMPWKSWREHQDFPQESASLRALGTWQRSLFFCESWALSCWLCLPEETFSALLLFFPHMPIFRTQNTPQLLVLQLGETPPCKSY